MTHEDVHDRASFVAYVAELRGRLVAKPDEWENIDLPSFLEAMEAWAHDGDKPAHQNPWRHTADVLTAATVYE
ncbi:MAG: hypothetical protein DI526_22900 [Caulobacter segnis]|uniref:DUF7660 domain-containing protein n=1 Tax=Caulobacter segnis TaxID=88688 RepID=A0A2W5WQY9_9CAUL|nr:MAG: hypothetical protein DI526_22900 [Caulobacter segnis]